MRRSAARGPLLTNLETLERPVGPDTAGRLTPDTEVGRTLRSLGPIPVDMTAPRDRVFDLIAAPYLGRTPCALADEISVLERGSDVLPAAHRTPLGAGLVATTVETVPFQGRDTVAFRLARGPVPNVVERFTLHAGSTRLDYQGDDHQLLDDLLGALEDGVSLSKASGGVARVPDLRLATPAFLVCDLRCHQCEEPGRAQPPTEVPDEDRRARAGQAQGSHRGRRRAGPEDRRGTRGVPGGRRRTRRGGGERDLVHRLRTGLRMDRPPDLR